MVPLGYDTNERRIAVNESEADRVRMIFRSYLKLGSLNLLMAELRKLGIVTKVRTLKTGETVGGIPFTRGPLAHLLRNLSISVRCHSRVRSSMANSPAFSIGSCSTPSRPS